jgi:hypothetical protein
MLLPRMPRVTSSAAQLRVREQRGLGRGVDAEGGGALGVDVGAGQDDRCAGGEQRKCLLHGEQGAADVGVEGVGVVVPGDVGQGRELTAAGVGEDDVEAAVLLDLREETVEVVEVRDVGAYSSGAVADGGHRLVDRFLTAAREEDVGAFRGEPSRGGQADAGGGAGDEGGLAVQLSHDGFSFSVPFGT